VGACARAHGEVGGAVEEELAIATAWVAAFERVVGGEGHVETGVCLDFEGLGERLARLGDTCCLEGQQLF
jgi:hypothetical protein